jgi:hypothetical protein
MTSALTVQQPHLLRQALLRAGSTVVAGNHRTQRQFAGQRGGNLGQEQVHRGGVRLHHGDIAESVDNQARQLVRLGMHQAMERAVANARAQRHRCRDPYAHESRINGDLRIMRQKAGRDQAVRVEGEGAVTPTFGTFQTYRRTWRPSPMGRRHRDFVAERPGVTRPQPAVCARQQPQQRMVGHGDDLSERGKAL